MRKGLLIVSLLFSANVYAGEITLSEWGVNLNGNVINSVSDLPGNITYTDGFFETGLGTVTMTFGSTVPSNYSVAMFFDHEIDENDNTYFNEYGYFQGTSNDSRLTYEIDEPGWGSSKAPYTGDIYDNFSDLANRGLDGKIFYDGYTNTNLSDFENPISDDVSMAMGWNFSLNGNETAVLEYTVSNTAPATGFYLAQSDRDDPETNVYLQSRLNVSQTNVPEPCTMSLLGIGIASLCFIGKRKMKW